MAGELAFVDVQGFKTTSNTFIVKEFCLLHKDFAFHSIVRSPCMRSELLKIYRRQADWLSYTYHGLEFDSGTMLLTDLVQHTLEHVNGTSLVVKGVEKVEWLKEIYRDRCKVDCFNIEDYDPTFKFNAKTRFEINAICEYHKKLQPYSKSHCALSNARELREYYLN